MFGTKYQFVFYSLKVGELEDKGNWSGALSSGLGPSLCDPRTRSSG